MSHDDAPLPGCGGRSAGGSFLSWAWPGCAVCGANLSALVRPYVTGFAEDHAGNFGYALVPIRVAILLGVLTIAPAGRSARDGPAGGAS